jgi:hypothetical protein
MRISAKSRIARLVTARASERTARVFLALAACVAMLSASVIPSSWAFYSTSFPASGAGTNPAKWSYANSGQPEPRLAADLTAGQPVRSTGDRAGLALGRLPVTFEENQGQADPGIMFVSRAQNHTLFIGPGETTITVLGNKSGSAPAINQPARNWNHPAGPSATFAEAPKSLDAMTADLREAMVRMKLLGAVRNPRVDGLELAQGKINYFTGQDPAKWRTGIPTYARVKERGVYPGVDLVYHGAESNPAQLEYDFVIAPGANADAISLSFEGASGIHLDRGDLVLETPAGDIRQIAPTAYQQVGNVRKAVASKYEIKGKGRRSVAFRLGSYDHNLPLVIDPTLVYSTYFSKSSVEGINGVAADASGDTYLTGYAAWSPTAISPFVTELDPTGQHIIYTTLFGASGGAAGNAIAVDSQGNAYVTGTTRATDFPVTAGAFQTTLKSAVGNAFVVKFGPGGKLVYATYLGGSKGSTNSELPGDSGASIAVGPTGIAYIGGNAPNYEDFPTTQGAFQTSAQAPPGAPWYFAGFVTAMNPTGTGLVYSTFLNGAATGAALMAGIAVDGLGDAFVSGLTAGDFPTTAGSFQQAKYGQSTQPFPTVPTAFVAKLNPTGSGLLYGTYVGDNTTGNSIAIDAQGSACITGTASYGYDFPTVNAFQRQVGGGVISKSVDGGANFVNADAGLPMSAAGSPVIDPSNPSTLYVTSSDSLYKSINGGSSWSKVGNGLPGGPSITIDPVDSSIIYAGLTLSHVIGSDYQTAIYKSVDGGNNFTQLTTAVGASILVIDPQTPTTIYGAQSTYDSKGNITAMTVAKSTDGGSTWAPASQGLATQYIFTIAIDPQDTQTLYAGTANGLFKTTDGAEKWLSTPLSNGAETIPSSISIDPNNPSIVYAINHSQSQADSDGGHGNPNKKTAQQDDPAGAVVSQDGGTSWTSLNGGLPQPSDLFFIAVDPVDSSIIYLGAAEGLFKNTGGQNWAEVLGGGNMETGAFALDPKTEGILYLPGSEMQDAFVTKLSPDGSSAVISTLLGGSAVDSGVGIALDATGNIYVAGITYSSNFPVTANAIQSVGPPNGNLRNTFLAVFSPAGALTFSTYLGSDSDDIAQAMAVDPNGNAVVAGYTFATDFPLKQPIQTKATGVNDGTTPFVYKIATQAPSQSSVQVTAATITGEQLTVQGSGFAAGAVIVVNATRMATANSSKSPSTSLVSKKGGTKIAPGQTVTIQVRNPDKTISNSYSFTRLSN